MVGWDRMAWDKRSIKSAIEIYNFCACRTCIYLVVYLSIHIFKSVKKVSYGFKNMMSRWCHRKFQFDNR